MPLLQNSTSTKEIQPFATDNATPLSAIRWWEAWYWGVLVGAIIVDLLYIRAFAVDAICMDEWAFIPYLQQFNEGRLDYGHFLTWQHNEHKPFFPLIMLFCVARVTHYDVRALQYAGLVIIALTGVGVLLLARRRLLSLPLGVIYMSVVAAFMLDLRQWENLINGFSGSTVAVSMFFVFSLYFLDAVRKFDWRIIVAILAAFCGTFSCANGLLVWPLGIFLLLCSRALSGIEVRRAMLAPLAVWLAASGAVVSFYFATYEGVRRDLTGNIATLCSRGRLLETMQTFFTALANPLSFEPYGAVATGVAMFLLLVLVFQAVIRRQWKMTRDSIAPLTLLLFGLLSTAMIFLGRSMDGPAALLTSRYAAITCFSVVGLFTFVASLEGIDAGKKMAVLACLTYAMFVATLSTDLYGLAVGPNVRKTRLEAAEIVRNYRIESDRRLSTIMPFPTALRMYAPYLEQQRYSVFGHR
ncbi:MAG: hypothetical protein C5B53_10420 [Candidatus Melainabacteria bacterium]|nr:MAG: hypothetical protein C5B53_10420 [Candidatus Melainabacteria bacterium]